MHKGPQRSGTLRLAGLPKHARMSTIVAASDGTAPRHAVGAPGVRKLVYVWQQSHPGGLLAAGVFSAASTARRL